MMMSFAHPVLWILCIVLILSSLGVILAKKPVYSGLSFLLTLLSLSGLYLQLSAQFIAVMQVLVYAGAILVIFMFVIILFQDAHQQIPKFEAKSAPFLLWIAAFSIVLALVFLGARLIGLIPAGKGVPEGFGTVQSLGQLLYVDFFFPFEAVILLFLIAVVGALYIGRKSL
jgi:NADH-quinone oxidoreductase subunit J